MLGLSAGALILKIDADLMLREASLTLDVLDLERLIVLHVVALSKVVVQDVLLFLSELGARDFPLLQDERRYEGDLL